MATRRNSAHLSFYLDEATHTAVERAATDDERTKSDWIRAVLRRELRRLGLLTDPRKERSGDARR